MTTKPNNKVHIYGEPYYLTDGEYALYKGIELLRGSVALFSEIVDKLTNVIGVIGEALILANPNLDAVTTAQCIKDLHEALKE